MFEIKNKKIGANLFLTALPVFLTAGLIQIALAYFGSARVSGGNIFQTGVLAIDVATTTADFQPPVIEGSATSSFTAVIRDAGTIAPKYEIYSQNLAGDACAHAKISARRGGLLLFAGALDIFSISELALDGPLAGDWRFEIEFLPSAKDLVIGSKCQFELVFHAWQANLAERENGFHVQNILPLSIQYSTQLPVVRVAYPNGGQRWFIVDDECVKHNWCRDWCEAKGMNRQCEYDILWEARAGGPNPNNALWIDIWYSVDSGQTWLAKIASRIPNIGKFLWKIPYDPRFISDKARVKVVAFDKQNEALWNYDTSDADFCPPLLSIEDLMNQASSGIEPVVDFAGVMAFENNGSSTLDSDLIAPMTIEQINRDLASINGSTTEEIIILPSASQPVAETSLPESELESASESQSEPEPTPIAPAEPIAPIKPEIVPAEPLPVE